MKVLFKNTNLIGDGLSAIPVMQAFAEQNPEAEIVIWVCDDGSKVLYNYVPFKARVVTDPGLEMHLTPYQDLYDHVFHFDVGKAFTIGDQYKCHITDAYARLLNIPVTDKKVRLNVPGEPSQKDLVLISPFSRSCASHSGQPPNKMLPPEKWLPVIKYLSTLGTVHVLGAKGDYMPLNLSEDQYLIGLPLDEVARLLKYCKVVVTIDNGLSHLAAAMNAPMMLFYPACLGQHWIMPIGNDYMGWMQLDPANETPAKIQWAVREVVEKVLAYKEKK